MQNINCKKILVVTCMFILSILMSFILSFQYFNPITKVMFVYEFQYLGLRFIFAFILFLLINSAFNILKIKKGTSDFILLALFIMLSLLLTLRPIPPWMNASEVHPQMSFNLMGLIEDFSHSKYSIYLLVGNILFYFPIGYYSTSLLLETKIVKFNIPLFILYITCIELIQYTFKLGNFDIVDIILNTLGYSLGLLFCIFIHKSKMFEKPLRTTITK